MERKVELPADLVGVTDELERAPFGSRQSHRKAVLVVVGEYVKRDSGFFEVISALDTSSSVFSLVEHRKEERREDQNHPNDAQHFNERECVVSVVRPERLHVLPSNQQ